MEQLINMVMSRLRRPLIITGHARQRWIDRVGSEMSGVNFYTMKGRLTVSKWSVERAMGDEI
jgi:hypothetical protein